MSNQEKKNLNPEEQQKKTDDSKKINESPYGKNPYLKMLAASRGVH